MKNEIEMKNKWGFLCESIEDEAVRNTTMQVLENSAAYMVENNFTTEEEVEALLSEDDTAPNNSADTTSYVVPKVMLPVIRRVMPQLIAHELVSVQPIQGRKGVIFYAKYEYTNAKGGVTAGQEYTFGNYSQDELNDRSITGQAYYSSQKIGPLTVTLDGGAEGATVSKFTFTDSFLKSTMSLIGVEIYPAEGGQSLSGTLGTPAGGSVEVTLGTPITLAAKETKDLIVFVSYNQESTTDIPEMQFTIDNEDVSTKERKLRVRFTQEAVQDLKNHYGINLEAELVKMASIQMNYEIDRELIQFIDHSVISQLKYSHNWNFNGDDPVYQFTDRHRALAQSIFGLAGKVAQYNRQGAANWAVVSPKVAAILTMLPEFTSNEKTISPNIYTIGTMSKIKYFVDPNRVGNDEDTILLGFKSNISSFGAGVVYSPYANWMTPNILNPDNFDTNKGFFSRYAMTLAPRGEYFYAKLAITGLPALGSNELVS